MHSSRPQANPSAPLARVRAIYFDLDDTLCAYWEASKLGMRRAFESFAPPGLDADDLIRAWAATFREFSPTLKASGWYEQYLKSGEPTRTEQMRLMLLRVGIEDEALARTLSESYMRERNQRLRLFEDAKPVLDRLQPRFPLGLITNGPADIQRQEIETLQIAPYFDHVLIEGEMGEGKPKPGVFERARDLVGVAPGDILFVGNSYAHDIRPALENGWRAVWIRRATDVPPSSGPGPSRPEFKPEDAPAPDAEIGRLADLLPLVGL